MYLAVIAQLPPWQQSRGLHLCRKPGQLSQHYFGITKEIILRLILGTIPYLEEMENGL